MTVPKLTIVICTRNRAEQLGHAISYLLNIRSSEDWRAVIVDNGSYDATKTVIEEAISRDPRISYYFQPVPGLGASRDFALSVVETELVSFTDDDCYIAENYVDAVISAFAEDLRVCCIGGQILLHDLDHARITIDERINRVLISPNTYVPAGCLHGANLSFRVDVLRSVGGFDSRLGAGTAYPCEDIDAVARVVWSGHYAAYDPRPSVRHDHGRTSSDIPALEKSYDAGRGAYMAKFIGERGSRGPYLGAWIGAVTKPLSNFSLRRFRREGVSFLSFSIKSRRAGLFLTAVIAIPSAYVLLALALQSKKIIAPMRNSSVE